MTSTTTSRRSMRPPPTTSAWNGVRSATCWCAAATPPASGTGAGAAQGPRTRAACNATANDPTKYSVQTLVAGNPNLTEEKGKSWGAGFVWDVTDGMSLTVDY
ncbi:hypothetical protein G6F54_014131 [Rhizopus delemar]|nr:hypothetical protein G6F54_014131 [Rhizopus delemar]